MNFEFGLNQNPKAMDILQLQLASIAKTFSVLSAEGSQGKHKNRVGTNRYQPLQFWVYKGKGTDFCFWPFGLFSKYLYPRPDVHSGLNIFHFIFWWQNKKPTRTFSKSQNQKFWKYSCRLNSSWLSSIVELYFFVMRKPHIWVYCLILIGHQNHKFN